jgi:ppGpp synthetase/RelA/SpoT-type nucleotidyltranferase
MNYILNKTKEKSLNEHLRGDELKRKSRLTKKLKQKLKLLIGNSKTTTWCKSVITDMLGFRVGCDLYIMSINGR